MVCAVASLGTNHAKPFGPELQVKQMLGGPCGRGKELKIDMLINRIYLHGRLVGVHFEESILEFLDDGSKEFQKLLRSATIP